MQLSLDEMFEDQIYGPRDGLGLREFQLDALEKYCASESAWHGPERHQYCIHAGTGSGKTILSGLIASHMLNTGRVDQVIVICPNRSVRRKTKHVFAAKFGIHLAFFNRTSHADGIPRCLDGYILTYQHLIQNPNLHRQICDRTKTLVIFDEVHHLSENNDWADAAVIAFNHVPRTLSLTGSMYGKHKVLFVNYESESVNGYFKFKPDSNYSLGRAIAEGVCRKPVFLWFGAKVSIQNGRRIAKFGDSNLNQADLSAILQGAIAPGSPARLGMLREALSRCKAEKRKAIIFLGSDFSGDKTPCKDAKRLLPKELHELGYTEADYEVVVGDDPAAQDKIEAFDAHPTKWILVSVNMISEGTDIPRLSVPIFLSPVTAKQTNIQRIGRALRMMVDDAHKDALVYMFPHPFLLELADEIDREREFEEVALRERRQKIDPGSGFLPARNVPVAVAGGEMIAVTFQRRTWSAEAVADAQRKLKADGLPGTMLETVLKLFYTKPEGGTT